MSGEPSAEELPAPVDGGPGTDGEAAPAVLRGFNLAAFVVPGWWALLHRMWGWSLLFVLRWVAVLVVARTVFPLAGEPSWLALPVTLDEPGRWALSLGVYAAVWGLELWFAKHADRLLWESRRRSGMPWRGGLAAYLESRANWTRGVLALFGLWVLVAVLTIVFEPASYTPLHWTIWGSAWVTNAGALAWWWIDRRRPTR